MNGRLVRIGICAVVWLAFTYPSPAPLIYRPGEGWIYEPVGTKGDWMKGRAKDQLEVAKTAFEKKDYKLALRAARRTVSQWPLSDYAPEAQFLAGRCYEARGNEERAFKEYQKVLEKYPKTQNHEEIIRRQYEIANHYLAGKWFRLWGVIPTGPSMDKTADMYQKIIRNGPYTDIAPQAQMKIGAAHENKWGLFKRAPDYASAVQAYERAADRYNDRQPLAADALFKAGLAYYKQALTSEYDQNIAAQAIATFEDFITLYKNDARVAEANKLIGELKTEQARGSYQIAKFYEKRKRYRGAEVYYNDVLDKDRNSKYGAEAKKRLEELKARAAKTAKPPASGAPEKPASGAPEGSAVK